MNKKLANELFNTFPEMPFILERLKDMTYEEQRRYGDAILMSVFMTMSQKDGDILMIIDRLEHIVNEQLSKTKNPIGMLGTLERLKYKVNKVMDSPFLDKE